jgi:8-oxo-dGTP pyrophosphatase MutT (NUDIX family)
MKDEIVFENEFLTVKKHEGWFLYAERKGMDSIAFILKDGKRYGLIHEQKPPFAERSGGEMVWMTTAFGGSLDKDKSITEILLEEVVEETGYVVGMDRVSVLGSSLVSTQMNQLCYLFLVDVTGLEPTEKAEWESGEMEFVGNKIVWLDAEGVVSNGDWKSITILAEAGILVACD